MGSLQLDLNLKSVLGHHHVNHLMSVIVQFFDTTEISGSTFANNWEVMFDRDLVIDQLELRAGFSTIIIFYLVWTIFID